MPTFESIFREINRRKERLCHHIIDESNRCQNKVRNGNIYCKEHKHLYHHDDARGQ